MSAESDSTVEFEAVPKGTGPLKDALEDDGRRPARLALYAGIALLVLGWLVLYLGYNGAATHPPEASQLPYVVSGGFGGAALIVLGGVMVLAHILLSVQTNMRSDIQGLASSIEELVDTLSRGPAQGSPNGSVVVIRGGGTFHRPGCRLVANKEGLRHLAPSAAAEKGLTPCRVCKPQQSKAGVGYE